MPYKSKKNRRSISPNRFSATRPTVNAETVSSPASVNQAVKSSVVYSNTSKATASAIPVQTHFLREIKWIGLVAVVIVIFMVVAYYIFR